MARRELLYAVVRDAMTRAGVLSAGYKFKVLSLDARGRQFLVMVDLARNHGGETSAPGRDRSPDRPGRQVALRHPGQRGVLAHERACGRRRAESPGRRSARPLRNPCRWTRSPPGLDSQPAALESAPAPLEAAPGAKARLPATTLSRPKRWRLSSERWPTAWPTRPRPRPPQWACHMAPAHVPSTAQPAWAAKLHAADRFRRHRTAGCPGSARAQWHAVRRAELTLDACRSAPQQFLLGDRQRLRPARQHQGVAVRQRRIRFRIDRLAVAAAQAHHAHARRVQRQLAERAAQASGRRAAA